LLALVLIWVSSLVKPGFGQLTGDPYSGFFQVKLFK
jgi:hypothetical protein